MVDEPKTPPVLRRKPIKVRKPRVPYYVGDSDDCGGTLILDQSIFNLFKQMGSLTISTCPKIRYDQNLNADDVPPPTQIIVIRSWRFGPMDGDRMLLLFDKPKHVKVLKAYLQQRTGTPKTRRARQDIYRAGQQR